MTISINLNVTHLIFFFFLATPIIFVSTDIFHIHTTTITTMLHVEEDVLFKIRDEILDDIMC